MSDQDTVKKTKKKSDNVETSESNDMSSVFFSQYNTKMMPLENKKISGVIENFVVLFKRSLSGFLGKKIEFAFDDIKFCETHDLNIDKSPCVLSSIRLTPINQLGLIYFNHALIHTVIDILFGAGIYNSDTVISSLGKSGTVIAQKVAELCLIAFQEAVSEYEKIHIELIKTTEQQGLILNQPLADQFFNLTFHVDFNGVNCPLSIAIPDTLFENLTLQEEVVPAENKDRISASNTLKKDIIDSTVILVASLQEIKLKISDIMELKSGDLIPIQDPTLVYLSHNQKKMFKASAGQSNALRVVKIMDTL